MNAIADKAITILTGHSFTVNGLYRAFTRPLVCSDFTQPVALKDLRHSYATILFNDIGSPLPIAQVQLGHSNSQTTTHYLRPSFGIDFVARMSTLSKLNTFG